MWQVDCVINTAKWLLPFQEPLRRAKHFLSPPTLTHAHDLVLAGAFEHISALEQVGFDLDGKTVLEIGSGWFPILPLMLRVAGARRIYVTDMHRLLDGRNLQAAANFLLQNKGNISDRLVLQPDLVERALACPPDLGFEETLEWFGFAYVVPFDTSRYHQITDLDLVVSHTVMEHIPREVIVDIFAKIKLMLNPNGLMMHGIDHTDHRSHRDRNLSTFDFLRYSDRFWNLLCLNPQDYTNRLRHSEYMAIMRDLGYDTVYSYTYVDKKLIDQVMRVPLWGRFRNMEPKDLATSWSHIVARLDPHRQVVAP